MACDLDAQTCTRTAENVNGPAIKLTGSMSTDDHDLQGSWNKSVRQAMIVHINVCVSRPEFESAHADGRMPCAT